MSAPSSRPECLDGMEIDQNIFPESSNSQENARSKPEDATARKMFIQAVRKSHTSSFPSPGSNCHIQKANLLRSRLQNAMRKVTDHQIDRRVSELEEHSRKQPRLTFPTRSSSPFYNKAATHPQIESPQIGSTETSSSPQPTPDLPAQPFTVKSSDRARKSTRTPPRTTGSPMQLSSPPATVIRHDNGHQMNEGHGLGLKERLSPSHRGDAVDGLLKLMSTSDGHTQHTWSG